MEENKPFKKNYPEAVINAYPAEGKPDWMTFEIVAAGLYTRCDLHMRSVIKLHEYLEEEIKNWLQDE